MALAKIRFPVFFVGLAVPDGVQQRWVMLWPWQTLEETLQKMQRCSEFIAFHGIT